MKKTFILRWNPEISSFTKDDFVAGYGFGFYDSTIDLPAAMNWSIYEWEKLEKGDDFFMFTTGDDKESKLVMYGTFSSAVYKEENWRSNSGRRWIHYAYFDCHTAFHPDSGYAIPVSSFRDLIPDYDFGHGHAGMVLENGIAQELQQVLSAKRSKCIESAKWSGTYTPRKIAPTFKILGERLYLNSSQNKLIEGYSTPRRFDHWDYKFAIALDYDKVWDTFWTIVENALTGKEFKFIMEIEDYKSLVSSVFKDLPSLKSALEKYRTILTEDSFVSFQIVGSRGRKILVSAEKEIFVKYGATPETKRFIKSLGFEKRDDIGMLEYLSSISIERSSIFGKEFSDEVYYQIKDDLKAEYYGYEDEDDLPF